MVYIRKDPGEVRAGVYVRKRERKKAMPSLQILSESNNAGLETLALGFRVAVFSDSRLVAHYTRTVDAVPAGNLLPDLRVLSTVRVSVEKETATTSLFSLSLSQYTQKWRVGQKIILCRGSPRNVER